MGNVAKNIESMQEVLDVVRVEVCGDNRLLSNIIPILQRHFKKSESWCRNAFNVLRDIGKVYVVYEKKSSAAPQVRIISVNGNITEEDAKMFDFDKEVHRFIKEKDKLKKDLESYRRVAEYSRNELAKVEKKLFDLMQEYGVVNTVADGWRVQIKKRPKSIIIEDESLLPDDVFKVTKQPSKTEIKKRIQAGHYIQGAKIESAGEYLHITQDKDG